LDAFFRKLPTIAYGNVVIKDISRSSRFSESGRKQGSLFYPVEIEAGFRPDALADAYYGDAEMDWLIWLANNITDPYYQWYLSENEFDDFINEKYGSYEASVKTILYYQNNWGTSEETLTVSFFNNTLAPALKKYYTPRFAENHKIIDYVRRQEDWTMATNRIVSFVLTDNTAFTNGELLQIWHGGEQVGLGTVITSNTSQVLIQHVSGNTTANSTFSQTLIGETSNVQANSAQSNIVEISISDAEAVYWSAVTAYDWEVGRNESRKDLLVINSQYAPQISEQLRKQLNT